ncbi:ergothioneine biosynthesis protein EgtC [Chamaesiphon sp. OTE_8_metabat_110]|uniref:ergothioneine biosynthesis protein EgtC n=1 Tax=Chamaesiphon sp. OTE_8_metabat_110 TaxID=2964696 RepID=UPI00286CB0E3|nr:ergothioneine biosynthesis protein EgtC [Chamaesiphon sp. OTE_8_metabat_110]
MCRLLAYQGIPQSIDRLIAKPEHSLIVQSYQPREMTAGVINADGFGIGWYHPEKDTEPFIYKHTQPIWTDINLPSVSRYVETGCMLSYVRSATPGQGVSLSNCQPFQDGKLLFIHNGFIDNFRGGLYKQIRDKLHQHIYQSIDGTTDSEHIFALFSNLLHTHPELPLEIALQQTLRLLRDLVEAERTTISANIVISDGERLIASRFAHRATVPSLYWIKNSIDYPDSVILASEPIFTDDWHVCPMQSIITVSKNLEIEIFPI